MRKGILAVAVALLITVSASVSMAFNFGDTWNVATKKQPTLGKCPTCGKTFLHVGRDITAKKGKDTYFNRSGTIKQIYDDPYWKTCIVIESNSTTFIMWHVDGASKYVKSNLGKFWDVNRKGRLYLGKVANLDDKGGSHIHLGQRSSPYEAGNISTAGALPNCNHKYKNLPKYKEKFKNPDQDVISFK